MRKWFQLAALIACLLLAGIVGALIMRGNILASGKPPDLSRYLLTKPQVLFSLQYGKDPSQVGMFIPDPTAEDGGEASGPSDFAIGFDGSIYIADDQNGKVKKFSRSGELLMVTEGRINGIAGIGVDSRGRVYVIHGTASNEIAVYSESGKRLLDVERKIIKAVEKLASRLASTQPQLKEAIFGSWGGVPAGAVWCYASGSLYFRSGQFVLKVDSQFEEAQVLKGYPLNGQGFLYTYRFLPSQKKGENLVYGTDGSLINRILMPILERVEITIHRPDGSEVRKFTLPRGDWSEVERLVPIRMGDINCDGRGHFYVHCSPLETYHLPLRPDNDEFFVVSSCAVLEYDDEGNFVGMRAVINEFTMSSLHLIEVDAQGNIYWLDFKADHVNIMMAPAS